MKLVTITDLVISPLKSYYPSTNKIKASLNKETTSIWIIIVIIKFSL